MSLDARRHARRRARASTVRPAHARRDRRRSVDATTRSRLGAHSASPVSAPREPSRRCDEERRMRRGDVTRRTEAHASRRARASAVRPAHARRDRRRSVGATTRSRLGARSASPVSALREPSRRCDEERRMRRGDVTRRTAARTAARTCVDGTTSARKTRSAALGRRDDSLAARRSLGVAGVGSERAEPAMRRGEQDEAR